MKKVLFVLAALVVMAVPAGVFAAEQTTPPAPRQPWRRPTVTFVPMQATAGGKSGLDNDGTNPTPV